MIFKINKIKKKGKLKEKGKIKKKKKLWNNQLDELMEERNL